ncbi:hypothetical protein ABTH30_23695, partial [Acinetobacter baumannii]
NPLADASRPIWRWLQASSAVQTEFHRKPEAGVGSLSRGKGRPSQRRSGPVRLAPAGSTDNSVHQKMAVTDPNKQPVQASV